MIVARHDLEHLLVRAAVRMVFGSMLTLLLAGQILSDYEARRTLFEPALIGMGLIVGILAVIHGRWRVEQTLLETRLAADLPLFALPALASILLVPPATGPISCLAVSILVARALVVAQEAAVFAHTRLALQPRTNEPARALPVIHGLARPALEPGVSLAPIVLGAISRCPVCGDEIASQPVHCAKCRTPHHADCLSYNGRCGIYACGGGGRRRRN